jgi:sugar O-acyltransferase (sialic acid O-acetyltransferase NeuD family)
MKHLIIIGVNILSDIVFEYAVKSTSFNKDWDFKGFLFSNRDSQEDIAKKKPLASYTDYSIEKDDVFVCSYYENKDRLEVFNIMKERGAEFTNIVHPSANVFSSAIMGVGNVIGAFVTLSANVTLGNMNIIQDHCNVGHDTIIGDCNHLFVNSVLCGKNKIGKLSSLFTGSLIYPTIQIGNSSTVAAGSVVIRNVKEGVTVMGNPAKKLDNQL